MSVSDSPATIDRRRERGDRTRRSILEAAATLASIEGLEGLSIGRLAEHLEISKSGLYAHFRSKEELQLAAIRTAEEMYERDIVVPALDAPPGLARLLRFCELFLDYLRDGPFPGGCFFIASSLDPARLRGRVQQLLSDNQRRLLDFFEECVREAQAQREIDPGRDPEHLAFAADAILVGADMNYVLFGDARFLDLARAEVRHLVGFDG